MSSGELSEQFIVPCGIEFFVSLRMIDGDKMVFDQSSVDGIILKIPGKITESLLNARSKRDLRASLQLNTNTVPYVIDFELDAFQAKETKKETSTYEERKESRL
jgi:hypothetical protein